MEVTVFMNLKNLVTLLKTLGPTGCYSHVLLLSAHLWLFDSKRLCQVLSWTLRVFFKENWSVFRTWSSIRNSQILWTCVDFTLLLFFVSFHFSSFLCFYVFSFFIGFFFLFSPNCGCVAILLDSDPSDKSILLAKLWLPLSGECERAAMSHLRDLFSFLPLSWIKPCTCPWGGNICHTYWSAWI